jgi:hypothetical protein
VIPHTKYTGRRQNDFNAHAQVARVRRQGLGLPPDAGEAKCATREAEAWRAAAAGGWSSIGLGSAPEPQKPEPEPEPEGAATQLVRTSTVLHPAPEPAPEGAPVPPALAGGCDSYTHPAATPPPIRAQSAAS